MPYDTIEYNGTEKTLADWGIALGSVQGSFVTLRASTLRFSVSVASLLTDPEFAFEGKIIYRLNRTSATGAADSFSDGSREFVGYCTAALHDGSADNVSIAYEFRDAWYFFENTLYQQPRATIPTTYPALEYKYTTDLSLFMKLGGSNEFVKITTGQQIQAVMQFILDNPPTADATPFQIGNIDPALNPPTYQVSEMSCAAVIQKCLELTPDATPFFDYTTDPPTLHVRKRENLTPVSLEIANGVDKVALHIRPCYERQPRSVLIYYRINSVSNGVPFVNLTSDLYPPGGATAGHRVVIQTFDLEGPTASQVSAVLNVQSVDANGSAAARLAWWKTKSPKLTDSDNVRIQTITISNATAAASTNQTGWTKGDAVSLISYPNEVIDSALYDWMHDGETAVVGVNATVSAVATITYEKRASSGGSWEPQKPVAVTIQTQLLLTNGSGGTYVSSGGTLGEDVPLGVAEEIYNSLATLQFEGQDIRVEAAITGQVTLANTLNFSNGRAEWATMNAQVQQIQKDYGSGQTTVSIGPARHISAADIVGLCLFNRTRRVKESNQVRVTGIP